MYVPGHDIYLPLSISIRFFANRYSFMELVFSLGWHRQYVCLHTSDYVSNFTMSSPPTRKLEERSQQENWDTNPTDDPSGIHGNPKDSLHHRESEESSRPTGMHDTDEPLPAMLSSKNAGSFDLEVPGAKPSTIYREKQIQVLYPIVA